MSSPFVERFAVLGAEAVIGPQPAVAVGEEQEGIPRRSEVSEGEKPARLLHRRFVGLQAVLWRADEQHPALGVALPAKGGSFDPSPPGEGKTLGGLGMALIGSHAGSPDGIYA